MRICIIPARGQSKRLPRKNILPLAGRPMLAWPIAAARQSKVFDRILVSTEDKEIAAAASATGAEVLYRPPQLATDRSTVVEVCLQVLDEVEAAGQEIEAFCCLYATAAFVSAEDLIVARALMTGPPHADFVMGVCEYNLSPFLALRVAADGTAVPMWPEYLHLQSQDYPHLVCSSGTFYWASTRPFRETRSFYGPPLRAHILPPSRALDLDTPEHYQEALMRANVLTARGAAE